MRVPADHRDVEVRARRLARIMLARRSPANGVGRTARSEDGHAADGAGAMSRQSRIALLLVAIAIAAAAQLASARSASLARFGTQDEISVTSATGPHEDSAVVPASQLARGGQAMVKLLGVPLAACARVGRTARDVVHRVGAPPRTALVRARHPSTARPTGSSARRLTVAGRSRPARCRGVSFMSVIDDAPPARVATRHRSRDRLRSSPGPSSGKKPRRARSSGSSRRTACDCGTGAADRRKPRRHRPRTMCS